MKDWHCFFVIILMNYREHDKNPGMFCSILTKLIDYHLNFDVSILGSHTNDIPGKLFFLC